MRAHELTDAQRAELKDLLDRRERELQDIVAALRQSLARPDAGSGAAVLDSVEEGDARMMASVDLEQLRRHEDELLDIGHSRERMHRGEYGRCEECDRPIPYDRLKALPQARLCIEHEQAREKAHPAGAPARP
ncbi:TraR/DksA family transcriptional regulator [Ramlibacter tataouinensis]|uniref:TraR/DksA family transcriptional regulator n=1 Tax=Ramlibacter tataouinensis TaxID=94132 RepID=UPI0022F384E8|nr:TraR/DksA family transcriptional regulator [Ramlibacter tataouinensis]WBY03258.1 TraR/DksA family transcriptional regulator [Ramlibacter tataouinensis]